MKFREFVEKWGLQSLKLKFWVLEGEFVPKDPDRRAAWELYVELLTRVTTQHLAPHHGDETAALESVLELFPMTREILRAHGSGADQFAKIAIPVLNQAIRPFTAKWHRLCLAQAFEDPRKCDEFRRDLMALQSVLRRYTRALGELADVEMDLADLEAVQDS